MTIKYVLDNRWTVPAGFVYYSRCSGGGFPIGSTKFEQYAYTDMVRRRPRPKRKFLYPTPATFYYYQLDGDGTTWPCKWPGDRFGPGSRTGSHVRVHASDSYKIRKSFDSRGTGGENEAILSASRNLTDSIAQWGESLAELSQTGKMILNRGSQIASIATALRRGNWKKLGEMIRGDIPNSVSRLPPSKRLANGWLELEFGWKPLVDDVYAAMEVYRSSVVKGQAVKTSRQHSVKGGFNDYPWSNYENIRDTTYPWARRIVDNGANASAKVYAEVSNPSLRTLNQLGLVNPALIGWQLLPFSFIVDWFLPISNILAYMTATAGLSNVKVCVVTERGSVNVWGCGQTGQATRSVNRDVRDWQTFPPLVTSTRSLGLWHAITGTSLVAQAFGRR